MSLPLAANLLDVAWWTLVGILVAGLLCVCYGIFIERTWYRTAKYRLQVLPGGASAPLTVLHMSDLHFVRRDVRMAGFLAGLPRADIAVVTGDMLGEPQGLEGVVAAVRPVRGRVGSYFVLGSNDYFVPKPLNYTNYFRRTPKRRVGERSRSEELIRALEADGWVHLKNRRLSATNDGVRLEVVGMDDPHIERHDLRVAPRHDPEAFGLAVVHSPDPAPELVALGYQLILSGHTHGGQVRMPFLGALVTNSQVPTKLCMGLSRFGSTYLHISPGLGTSKYAPFRFLCRPEATILELAAAEPARTTR
jgi:predicted MPP superfamily phosphohydrolase